MFCLLPDPVGIASTGKVLRSLSSWVTLHRMDGQKRKRKRESTVVNRGLLSGIVEDAEASVVGKPKKSKAKDKSLEIALEALPDFAEETCDRDSQRSLGENGLASSGEGSESEQDEEAQGSQSELDCDGLLSKLRTRSALSASDEEEVPVVAKKRRTQSGAVATAVAAPPTPKLTQKMDRVCGEGSLVVAPGTAVASTGLSSSSSSGLRCSCCQKLFDVVSQDVVP